MTLVFGQFTAKFNAFAAGQTPPETFRNDVDTFVLWFIYLFVARFVVVYISNTAISIAAIRTTRTIRKAFLESTLRQEVWHFDKESNGSISSQVTTNGNRINQGIAEKLATLVQATSLFFSAFIVALAVQWKLTLIVMTIVPAIFIVTGGCIAVDAQVEAKVTRIYSRAAVVAQDAISSVKTVHAFFAHQKIAKKYSEYLEDAHKEGWKKSPVYGILFSVEYFLVLAGTALAFWQGFRMYASDEITDVGTVLTVVLSVTIGATAMSSIAPQIQSFTNASSAAAELFSIIEKQSLLDPLDTTGKRSESLRGDIQIRNLSFAYPARPTAQVLHDLNLSIPAGKRTALVGASGCGKSTLVGLIERWYQPSSGQILLDGTDITEYNTKWLRSNVRLVQQEPVLFRGTVFENVAKGFVGSQADLPHDKQVELVEEACKASNAHDFITELPDGYHTQVGERASMLSGGQRQRVAIARSIISDPKILLLDEATSALDPRAEGIVQDALNRVSVDKTTLIIAHKLATVKSADNIVVMAFGRMVEQGTHDDLIAKDGAYAALVRAQDLGGDKGQADFSKEEADAELDRAMSLQPTKTETGKSDIENQLEHLTAGTVGYSLPKAIWIMLTEHPDLYVWHFISVIGCLIGGGTFPAQAILFSKLINVFILPPDEARDQADFYALMFFVVALANLLGYFAIGWACNTIAQRVVKRYRGEMLERMINFDQDFFDRPENSSGALTSKLTSVPASLLELLAGNLFLIFIVLVNLFASSILAIAYGWKLGLVVVFGGLPLLVGSGYAKIRLDQKLEKQADERFANSAGLATEAVTSIRTVASLTLEAQIMKEYGDALDTIVRTSARSMVLTMIGYALSQSIEFLSMALGFWYGSRLISTEEYTVPQFFVIFVAVIFGGQAAGQFFGYTTSISKAKGAANYILWLRTLKGSIREDEENKGVGPTEGPMTFDKVEFRYKQRDAARVLRGIDVDVRILRNNLLRFISLTCPRRSNPALTSPSSAPPAAGKAQPSRSSSASTTSQAAPSHSTTKTSASSLPASIAPTCPWCSRSPRSIRAPSARTSASGWNTSRVTRS